MTPLRSKLLSEFLGTAALLTIIVGSGIMGESLAQGNAAIALLANALSTGAGLFVLIQCLGSISGAHFNPVVSLLEGLWGRMSWRSIAGYWAAQLLGAIVGVWLAHLMFDQPIFQTSTKDRLSLPLLLSECVATFGLILTIALAGRKHVELAPLSVAAYIVSAYWFTSSTSFANPAVTLARSMTDTFSGIAPNGVIAFVGSQLAGALLAFAATRALVGGGNRT